MGPMMFPAQLVGVSQNGVAWWAVDGIAVNLRLENVLCKFALRRRGTNYCASSHFNLMCFIGFWSHLHGGAERRNRSTQQTRRARMIVVEWCRRAKFQFQFSYSPPSQLTNNANAANVEKGSGEK